MINPARRFVKFIFVMINHGINKVILSGENLLLLVNLNIFDGEAVE